MIRNELEITRVPAWRMDWITERSETGDQLEEYESNQLKSDEGMDLSRACLSGERGNVCESCFGDRNKMWRVIGFVG